jgi:hypothetical protein
VTTEQETLPSSWYGQLSEKNIERVAAMICARLEGKYFSIASTYVVNRPDPRSEFREHCKFEFGWTDRSTEAVRVMRHEGSSPCLAFSAGHYFWTFYPHEGACFSFDHDGFEVEFTAPCGDLHKHYFRVESAIAKLEAADETILCSDESLLAYWRERTKLPDSYDRNVAEGMVQSIERRMRGEKVKRRNYGYAIKSNRG